MDKVQMVLLKKSDIWAGEASAAAPTGADLLKYRELYKKPLPGRLISAIEALMDATSGGKGARQGGRMACV